MPKEEYKECMLCMRGCGVDRTATEGGCHMTADMYISHFWLHMWEEPPISGSRGSGAIFFDGCSLGCSFCQNSAISRGRNGKHVSVDELSNIMLSLQRDGAHNINLVTPTHFAPSVTDAVALAKEHGLKLPIVYNTSSCDSPKTIKSLSGTVDIYLPDFKYFRSETAKKYSNAENYPDAAMTSIAEMVKQVGEPVFDGDGIMLRGVIARILLLPAHVAEAKLILKYLYSTYGDKIYISLMSQYTPMPGMEPPLDRKVTREEYRQLIDYAERLGVRNAFIQEGASATDSFIPPFITKRND